MIAYDYLSTMLGKSICVHSPVEDTGSNIGGQALLSRAYFPKAINWTCGSNFMLHIPFIKAESLLPLLFLMHVVVSEINFFQQYRIAFCRMLC